MLYLFYHYFVFQLLSSGDGGGVTEVPEFALSFKPPPSVDATEISFDNAPGNTASAMELQRLDHNSREQLTE